MSLQFSNFHGSPIAKCCIALKLLSVQIRTKEVFIHKVTPHDADGSQIYRTDPSQRCYECSTIVAGTAFASGTARKTQLPGASPAFDALFACNCPLST